MAAFNFESFLSLQVIQLTPFNSILTVEFIPRILMIHFFKVYIDLRCTGEVF